MNKKMKKQFGLLASCMIIFFTFFTSCKKQQKQPGYIIRGEIKDVKEIPSKAYLLYSGKPIDSTDIVGLKFSFKGKAVHPRDVIIDVGDGPMGVAFILDNSVFEVTLGDKINMVKGGELNEIVNGFANQKDYQDRSKELVRLKDLYSESDIKKRKKEKDSVDILFNEMMGKNSAIEYRYREKIIEGNYPVLAKVYTLGGYYGTTFSKYSATKCISLLDEFEKEIGTSESITKFRNYQIQRKKDDELEASISKGKHFKDIEGVTADGKIIKLSEIVKKNKYTMLDFWASWCGSCAKEFPDQRKAYMQYHNKGFEIYSISIDEDRNAWLRALKWANLPWLNMNNFNVDIKNKYGEISIPRAFLISKDGTIVASGDELRGEGLQQQLKKIMEK